MVETHYKEAKAVDLHDIGRVICRADAEMVVLLGEFHDACNVISIDPGALTDLLKALQIPYFPFETYPYTKDGRRRQTTLECVELGLLKREYQSASVAKLEIAEKENGFIRIKVTHADPEGDVTEEFSHFGHYSINWGLQGPESHPLQEGTP